MFHHNRLEQMSIYNYIYSSDAYLIRAVEFDPKSLQRLPKLTQSLTIRPDHLVDVHARRKHIGNGLIIYHTHTR